MTTTYNGWKNKETWLVNVWLGDNLAMMQEEGYSITPDVIEELVQECIGGSDNKSLENGFLHDMLFVRWAKSTTANWPRTSKTRWKERTIDLPISPCLRAD